jgi:hypothetical protein
VAAKPQETSFVGLSYSEMKALLIKKDVFNFLVSNRNALSQHLGFLNNRAVAELLAIGLLNSNVSDTAGLNEIGRAFLNKHEAFEVGETKPS